MHEDAIAVVGLACRLPGAADARQFWANLVAGRDTVTRFTRERLLAAGIDPRTADRPDFVAARGVVDRADHFDWEFFGYSHGEARGIDPQQRIFLECAATALDDAAVDPHRFPGPIGVFAGCDAVPLGASQEELVAQVLGRDKDFLATRAAYKLRLTGPAMTVQTACSTSMVAVHQAVQSLLGYECDAALAGGVGLFFPEVTGYVWEEGGILSADGHCRPFDADASGTVSSSGAGVVVLRRLEDALRDGDRVVAVIRGTAVNNDGGEKIGFTAPSPTGQRDVIRAALARADVDPADIGYVEAHGTGTRLGDPVEVAALTAAFQDGGGPAGGCLLGAVKGNIGHTGSASGVSGLIKTALLLHHRELVPTAHFRRPNPLLKLETTPFTVADRHGPWPAGRPLLAGVSSFGVGGTNAHAVLEAAPTAPRTAATGAAGRGPRLLALSAASPAALRRTRAELARHLAEDRSGAGDLDAVARTLADGRRRHPYRGAVVARDTAEAVTALRAGAAEDGGPAGAPARTGPATVAFLYPGQGTLRPGGAAAGPYAALPAFRDAFDEVRDLTRRQADVDLAPLLGTAGSGSAAPAEWHLDPVHQQLGLFAIGYAFTRALEAWGVAPAAVLGNSVGEYLAALTAGVWELPDALRLVHTRARAMRDTAPGRMLAVELAGDGAREAVAEALAEFDDHPAGHRPARAVDAPDRLVLAGTEEQLRRVRERLAPLPTRFLETRRAFHSPLMAPAAPALRSCLAGLPARPPAVPVVSNVTGSWATAGELHSADYWAAQLCGTVRLDLGAETLLSSACDVFVELGPGTSMVRALRGHPHWTERHTAVPLLPRWRNTDGAAGTDDAADAGARALAAVGRLWEAGTEVDPGQFAGPSAQRCALPPHPLDSRPCGTGLPATAGPRNADDAGNAAGARNADDARAADDARNADGTPNTDGTRAADGTPTSGAARPPAAERPAGTGDPAGSPARPRLSERPELSARLDRYAAALVARFALRTAGLRPGSRVTAAELRRSLSPDGGFGRAVALFTDAMTGHGFLDPEPAGPGGPALRVPDDVAERLAAALDPAGLAGAEGVRRMLDHCADAYPDVLAGRREPVGVLYPDGTDTFLRGCLTGNDVEVTDAGPGLEELAAAVRAAGRRRPGSAPLRVLEVGGGSGELTWRVLDSWPYGPRDRYVFTDISRLAVDRARERAGHLGARQADYARLDLTADPVAQGFPAGGFDVVLAYNALHVVPDVRATLRGLRGLLAEGGWLGAVEVTRVALWTHLVWGLAPGWWDFADDLRTDSIHLTPDRWRRAFAEAGFRDVAVREPSAAADHATLFAAPEAGAAPTPGAPAARDAAPAPAGPPGTPDPTDPTGEPHTPERTGPDRTEPDTGGPDRPGTDTGGPDAADPDRPGADARGGLARIWTELLGTATVRAEDDFFALGGDSLMAVRLRSRVHRELDLAIPLAEFTDDPTFGRLVHLARAAGTNGEPGGSDTAGAGGTPGVAGPEGASSVTGAPLMAGATGATEPGTGPDTDTGTNGVPGMSGASGATEVRGAPWAAGMSGATGPAASRGPAAGTRATSAAPPPELLVLRGSGPGTPLFLAAPATGSALCYRQLARFLGPGRPVYGIDAPGLLPGDGRTPRRVEELAAHHVRILRQARPHGPYALGGWSVGALVAHEMAAQLERSGETVELLLYLDGYAPDSGGRPLGHTPRHLAAGLWHQALAAGRLGPAGRAARSVPGVREVFQAYVRAMLRYRPGPVGCDTVLFKTGLTERGGERLTAALRPLHPAGPRVVPCSGRHQTMLTGPHVRVLAAQVAAELERAAGRRAAGAPG
ncbi:beta-ketoacyl synthase N-terminal-like domain-containing protein [Streptomyces sp. NPDC018031]|uniref:type I polyketide synthase n=1 Tax=Streptomyces sp. NPDC018031 TaxID=3365033 RepID=UPI0037BADD68